MHYQVKHTQFNGKRVPYILQAVNGACPLIAISNVLLIREHIHIHPELQIIEFNELATKIENYLQERMQRLFLKGGTEQTASAIQASEDARNLLPKMETGLDINVRFFGAGEFEFTREINVFDAYGIRLIHGWVYDPQNTRWKNALKNIGYNQLVDKLTTENVQTSLIPESSSPQQQQQQQQVPQISSPSGDAMEPKIEISPSEVIEESPAPKSNTVGVNGESTVEIQSSEDDKQQNDNFSSDPSNNDHSSSSTAPDAEAVASSEKSEQQQQSSTISSSETTASEGTLAIEIPLNESRSDVVSPTLDFSPEPVLYVDGDGSSPYNSSSFSFNPSTPDNTTALSSPAPTFAIIPENSTPTKLHEQNSSPPNANTNYTPTIVEIPSRQEQQTSSDMGDEKQKNIIISSSTSNTVYPILQKSESSSGSFVEEKKQHHPPRSDSDLAELETEKQILTEFLNETQSQLTIFGLSQMHEMLREDELCVFFRNNHFSTLYKTSGQLYTLVTDVGISQQDERIVWAKLSDIGGENDMFLDWSFQPPGQRLLQNEFQQEFDEYEFLEDLVRRKQASREEKERYQFLKQQRQALSYYKQQRHQANVPPQQQRERRRKNSDCCIL